MICSKCRSEIKISVPSGNYAIAYCPNCDVVFVVDSRTFTILTSESVSGETVSSTNIIPTRQLEVGTQVYINNKEHKLFLEQGVISNTGYGHCRVEMCSLDKTINGSQIWFPNHWVSGLPKEVRRSDG